MGFSQVSESERMIQQHLTPFCHLSLKARGGCNWMINNVLNPNRPFNDQKQHKKKLIHFNFNWSTRCWCMWYLPSLVFQLLADLQAWLLFLTQHPEIILINDGHHLFTIAFRDQLRFEVYEKKEFLQRREINLWKHVHQNAYEG